MGDTKKVKHAGRFGSKFGKGIRDRIVEVEKKQRKRHECPNCGFERVKRISTGLFKCSKCGYTFAGGAYTPGTMGGKTVKKMVSQRKFLPLAKELIEASEEARKGLKQKKAEEKEPKEKTKKAEKKKAKKKKETAEEGPEVKIEEKG